MNHGRNVLLRVGRTRLLLVLVGISLGLWIVFGKLVVPLIIESAYGGESWSFLNSISSGRTGHTVQHYLQGWDRVSLVCLVSSLGFLLILLVSSNPAFIRRVVGETTPGSLGAIRMWTCAILLFTTFLEDLGSIAWLPAEVRQPKGMLRYLYPLPIGFEALLASEKSLRVFQLLTEFLLFLGLIGWRTRVVLPLAAFCHFLLLGILIDHSFFWHQNLVALYVLIVLCFTPCGDGWSIDRLQRIYQGQTVPDADRASPVYAWSRYTCWVAIALPYVASGLSKLQDGGLFWWNPTNMRRILYFDTLTPREFDWALSLRLTHAPDIFFSLVGLFGLFSETFFGLVLFSHIARRIFPVLAIMMHIGILLFQRILFIDLILLQLVFFDFTPVRKAIGVWLAGKCSRLCVLYDALCPFCRRTVRLLTSLDLFSRLEFFDFRRLDLDDYYRRFRFNLTLKDLEEEMYIIFQDKAYPGFYAYRRIALAVPAFWPLAPWLFLPGVSFLGGLLYRYMAHNRLKFLQCDSYCPEQPSEAGESAKVTSIADRQRGFGYVLASSGIVLIALLCWFYRIEFYPLTSWHLYSRSNTSGHVQYKKVLAQYESGVRSPARLEDTIGAIAWDARYSRHLERCFKERPDEVEICKAFLGAAASAYNKKAQPGERVTQYEIQVWRWDFRSHPSDTNYGTLTDRFVFEINTGKMLRQRALEDRSVTDAASPVEPHVVKDGNRVTR